MQINVSVTNGTVSVTDVATGKALDWVDTVDLVLGPDNTPILYLGTTHFTSALAIGPAAVAAGAGK